MIAVVWMAFLAIGAGVLHLAMVIGSSPFVAALLVVTGVGELVWSVVALRDRVRLPRLALSIASGMPLLWAVVLTVAPAGAASIGVPGAALIAASALQLVVAAILAVQWRSRAGRGHSYTGLPEPQTASTAPLLLSMLAAGILVGGVTTPALADTVAGQNARPHGDHLVDELGDIGVHLGH